MINYKTIPHEFKPYTSPFPSEAFGQGILIKQGQYDKAHDQIQSQIDYVENLPSLPGADTQRKQELLAGFHSALNDIGGQDLTDANVSGQINSYVSNLGNNKDLINIVGRAVTAKNLQAKYDKLTENGQQLGPADSLPLDDMREYVASGKFISNKKFSGDIYKPFDFQDYVYKAAKEVEQDLTSTSQISKDNWWEQEESLKKRDANKIYSATTQRLTADPVAMAAIDRQVQAETKQTDPLQYYQTVAREGMGDAQTIKDNASYLISTGLSSDGKTKLTPQEIAALSAARDKADETIRTYSTYLDPSFNDYAARRTWKKDLIDKVVQPALETYTTTEHKTKTGISDVQKIDRNFANQLTLQAQGLQNSLKEIEARNESSVSGRKSKLEANTQSDVNTLIANAHIRPGDKTTKVPAKLPLSIAKQQFDVVVELGTTKTWSQSVQQKDEDGLPMFENGKPVMTTFPGQSETVAEKKVRLTPSGGYVQDGQLILEFKTSKGTITKSISELAEMPDEKPVVHTPLPGQTNAPATGATPPNKM